MVGKGFCKCLYVRVLFRSVLCLGAIYAFVGQPTLGRRVTTSRAPVESVSAAESVVEFTPAAVTFQDVPAGETNTQIVKVTNTGEQTIQIKKISTSSADLQITGILLPVVVAHGTSESFTVSFRPKAEGQTEGRISILTSAASTPLVLSVKASTVASQSELTASEAAIDFEDVALGSIAKHEVSLTNVGNRDLNISGVAATGGDFGVSGATPARLSPGQSISVEVSFTPRTAKEHSGQLTVSTLDGSSLAVIPLTGKGANSSSSAVKLNWEESPVTVAGYVVYRSAESSGPYTRISQASTPEYIDTGLAAGHTYFYVVTSLGADDVESEYSPPISATVPEG